MSIGKRGVAIMKYKDFKHVHLLVMLIGSYMSDRLLINSLQCCSDILFCVSRTTLCPPSLPQVLLPAYLPSVSLKNQVSFSPSNLHMKPTLLTKGHLPDHPFHNKSSLHVSAVFLYYQKKILQRYTVAAEIFFLETWVAVYRLVLIKYFSTLSI